LTFVTKTGINKSKFDSFLKTGQLDRLEMMYEDERNVEGVLPL